MQEAILKTKLFPPPGRPNQVQRIALMEKLAQAWQRGAHFALVSAPAGFGKTTLVVDWARAGGKPFAWLALEEGDNDLLRFWRYLHAALEWIDGRIGADVRDALYANQEPAIQQVITGLINDIISLDQEFLLVLDDYHVIELPAIHDSLNFLLDHLPPQMTLVIITRSDPPLNLARRRGRGQMTELRAGDLRFTVDETAALLNQSLALGLSETDIASLSQRTEGWIAGLQMAALSMLDEVEPHRFVEAFSGDNRHIADYLVEEVLQRQLVEVQNFLLQTSILDRLNASLCNAVTGRQDSAAMLNTLERANLFLLPMDNRREWFRYYHLFAELLRQRLRENFSREAIASLHRNASDWYESQGEMAAAIQHARAINDTAAILRILETYGYELFASGELPLLVDLAGLVPLERRKDAPRLCILVAWAALATSRFTDVPEWLSSIETGFGMPAECALSDPEMDPQTRASLLEVLVIRLHLPSVVASADQLVHIMAIRKALDTLPRDQICLLNPVENLYSVITFNLGQHAEQTGNLELAAQTLAECIRWSRDTRNSNLFYLAAAHLGNVQVARGQLHAAYQNYTQALEETTFPRHPLSPFAALVQAGLGAIHLEWGDLVTAEQYFNQSLLTARLWNLWEARLSVAFGLAMLKQCQADVPGAVAALNQLDFLPLPGQELPVRAYAAWLGGPEAALDWLAAHPDMTGCEPDPGNEFLLLTAARLLACTGRVSVSADVLRRIIRYANSRGRKHLLLQATTALAVVAGQPDELMKALELGEPEGYTSIFWMEGEAMGAMLQSAARTPNVEPRIQAYARRILAGFGRPLPRRPKSNGGLVEPLSERELEVLGYIARGLSNPEIASRLYLSANTLKAHTQNIFTKLDVHNRVQAVTKAKELGLIE